MITTCTTCGKCYEAGSEEQANEPTRFCPACWRKRSSSTPGPWHVRPPTAQNPSRAIVSAMSGGVTIYDAPLTVETAANARLIAAAPDLLTACRLALPILQQYRESIFASNQIDGVVRDLVEKAALDTIDAVILLAGNAVANAEGGGS